ncbi:MAG TPA: sigma-70 family RNA polymerase sigma factor [Sorangium sp.]|nr:sigma-70 family RNA polymerase sigma factor [Sorangium sp.]
MPADHGEEEAAVLAAARAGDHAAFAALSERYRRRLRAHCYRMLGSFDEAEDMVQEVLLRAWRGREGFQGRSLFRTWLYCIATNACLNTLERAPPRVLPQDLGPPVTASTPASQARSTPPLAPEVPPRWQGREFRMAPVGANRQPAAAAYLRRQGEAVFRLSGVHVLRVADGQIAEITTFSAELCAGFRLPPTLTD